MRTYTQFLHRLANGKSLVGVEVGVFLGDNALSMLKHLNIKHLYLIDPYWNAGKVKEKARNRLSEYQDKITWIYKSSIDGIKYLPNNLDFVYLDGDHTYSTVHKEIELYFPKIKEGGILGGHDYLSVPNSTVKQAVDEFFINQQCGFKAECYLPVAGIMGRPDRANPYSDNWLIIKPFSCNFYWGNINEFRQMHFWTAATLKSISKSAQIKVYYEPNVRKTKYWEMLSDYAEIIPFKKDMLGDLKDYYNHAEKQEKSNLRSMVNIIRECLLYQHGGMFFDFDILFVRNINSLAFQDEFFFWSEKSKRLIGASVFKIKKGDDVLIDILDQQKGLCGKKYHFLSFMTIFSDIIKEKKPLSILDHKTFFPFPPGEWSKIFSKDYKLPNETLGIHWWNQIVPPSVVDRMDNPIYSENLISRIVREKLGEEIVEDRFN